MEKKGTIKTIPQSARRIDQFNKRLSNDFQVEISIVNDTNPYIIMKRLRQLALSKGKFFAVTVIDRARTNQAFRDASRAAFETVGEGTLKKMTETGKSSFDYAQEQGEDNDDSMG